jgi:1,4-dihydroxy-6-naphthoate synthase
MIEGLHNSRLIDNYLSLYANEDALDYGEEGKKAIQTFFNLAYNAGLLPQPVEVEFIS